VNISQTGKLELFTALWVKQQQSSPQSCRRGATSYGVPPRPSSTDQDHSLGSAGLRQGHSEAAEELYYKTLGIAEEQEAKLWQLRAAASLARLRRDQDRRAEARDLLAPVYGWFTEGFDTPDLKEAKVLLGELA
jgi:hypothetical protein